SKGPFGRSGGACERLLRRHLPPARSRADRPAPKTYSKMNHHAEDSGLRTESHKYHVAIVLLWLLLSPQSSLRGTEITDRVLSLDDSVRLALHNSPALLSSREDVDIALQRVR